MTDKVQKIREEVKMVVNRRLNLLNGDYFNLIKETDGFTNEIMDIINSMQEEPKKCIFAKDSYTDEDRKVLCEDCKEKCEYSKKEEPVSEELGEYINELSKQFPEVSFAKLSRIAVRVAKWQKEQIKEALLSEVLPCFMHGGEADEIVAKLEEVLNKKK